MPTGKIKPDHPQMGDPCYFHISPAHHEQRGRVVGLTREVSPRFDVEGKDGVRHNDAHGVRRDYEAAARWQ